MALDRRHFVKGLVVIVGSLPPFLSAVNTPGSGAESIELIVLNRLQTLAIRYPVDRPPLSARASRHITLGKPSLHQLLASLPRARRDAVRRGSGWFLSNVNLHTTSQFVPTFERSWRGAASSARSDALASVSVALCAADRRLTGADDAVAKLWLSGLVGKPIVGGALR